MSTSLESLKMLINMKFGSHIYGTNLPSSDVDIKGVYLPAGKDILLQRVQDTIHISTKDDRTEKNTSSDIDTEIFSLQQYLKLLLDGQTMALDMLFTPRSFYLCQPHAIWEEILANKNRFLHSGVTAFARYCRQQAAKYGIKGSRLAALRSALEFVTAQKNSSKGLKINTKFD